jgi:hypothetical protein
MHIPNSLKPNLLKLRNTICDLFPFVLKYGETKKLKDAIAHWRAEGWVGSVPYLVKRAMLRAEARRIGAKTFVETGTYMGDTPWALRDCFRKLYSIEVQPELAAIARKRFSRYPEVEIVQGDSAKELSGLMGRVEEPALFWLDGHYSAGITGRGAKDCPIYEELEAIAGGMRGLFSIMIDDARCFGTDPAYPGIEQMEALAAKHFPQHQFAVWNDVIHIKPRAERGS